MARPGLTKHPKFLKFVHLLQVPEPHARGLLEYLWDVAYECGDPLIGDAVTVELAAKWNGEPGALCRALSTCGSGGQAGFIEKVDGKEDAFEVHDLYDHAPEYVKKRMEREAHRKACGKTISDLRREAGIKSGKVRKRTKGNKRRTSVEQTGTNGEQTGTNVVTPAPAPAPAPAPKEEELPTEVLCRPSAASVRSGFDSWWQAYPRKVGKEEARKSYAKVVKTLNGQRTDPAAFLLDRAQTFARSPKGRGDFCPHPATWLNQGRYDDDPAEWNRTSGPDGRPVPPKSQHDMLADRVLGPVRKGET